MASPEPKKKSEQGVVWGGPPTRYYTAEPPAGVVTSIKGIEDLPLKLVEGMIEGINKNPADFLVMGLGFYLGYNLIDINAYIMRQIKEIMAQIIVSAAKRTMEMPLKVVDIFHDISNMPIEVASGLTGALEDLAKASGVITAPIFPGKHITPASKGEISAPGVSYYGPPPTGFSGSWPPLGMTLAQMQNELDNAPDEDKWKWILEIDWAQIQLKIMMGCLGALTAYALTRPGFITETLKGIGEITKGVGEIVPL